MIKASTYEYRCTGFISGYTACNWTGTDPKRVEDEPFKVGPDYLKEKYPILKQIRVANKRQLRVFPR